MNWKSTFKQSAVIILNVQVCSPAFHNRSRIWINRNNRIFRNRFVFSRIKPIATIKRALKNQNFILCIIVGKLVAKNMNSNSLHLPSCWSTMKHDKITTSRIQSNTTHLANAYFRLVEPVIYYRILWNFEFDAQKINRLQD